MNILLIHNYYRERGGEDSVFENEYSALLHAEGVSVYKYSVKNTDIDEKGFFGRLKSFISILHNGRVYRELIKLIEAEKIDIVHVHNVFPMITPRVYRILKKKTNVKIVQTLHNYRFVCPNGSLFRDGRICYDCENGKFAACIKNRCFKDSLVFSTLYAYLIRKYNRDFRTKIDCYIALNNFVKTLLTDAGFDPGKIVIKDNALPEIAAASGETADRDYFLFMGRITAEKGIRFLTEFFMEHPELKLAVAGTGPILDELRQISHSHSNIKFVGFADGGQKMELLNGAKALIVPSLWYENYPMTVVEAMRNGTPVIASDIGGLTSIITDGYDGFLFRAGDKNSLSNAIEKITDNKNDISANVRTTYLSRMESAANTKKLVDIYRELLK